MIVMVRVRPLVGNVFDTIGTTELAILFASVFKRAASIGFGNAW